MASLCRKSLGQRSVEDGQQGAFNNEELVFRRETLPAAGVYTQAAMEMNDLEVQKGLKETVRLTLLKIIVV